MFGEAPPGEDLYPGDVLSRGDLAVGEPSADDDFLLGTFVSNHRTRFRMAPPPPFVCFADSSWLPASLSDAAPGEVPCKLFPPGEGVPAD